MSLSGLAIQMGLTIYLGNRLGSWLDIKYSKEGFEIGLTLFAIFLSLYSMIRRVTRLHQQ